MLAGRLRRAVTNGSNLSCSLYHEMIMRSSRHFTSSSCDVMPSRLVANANDMLLNVPLKTQSARWQVQHTTHDELKRVCNDEQLGAALSALELMNKQALSQQRTRLFKVMQICKERKDIVASRRVYALVKINGFLSKAVFSDELIRLFGGLGSLPESDEVFHNILKPTLSSWNTIILMHGKLGKPETVFELFQKMEETGVRPDDTTFSIVLKALGSLRALTWGRGIHKQIILNELDKDKVIENGLIDMYAKCGSLDDAYSVFERLSNRNAISWGSMITGYVQFGKYFLALETFVQMQSSCVRESHVTLTIMLKACGAIGACGWGKILHCQILEGSYESNVLVGSTIVDFYGKCACLDDALSVFAKLQSRNEVSWNALLGGYAQHGQSSLVLKFFERMQQGGVPANKIAFLCVLKACGNMGVLDEGQLIHHHILVSGQQIDMPVGSSLVDMYAKCGDIEAAQRMFNCLPKRDVVSWSAMIAGYSQEGRNNDALQCFEKMQQQGIQPNKVSFLCSLKACGSAETLLQGHFIHDRIVRSNLEADNMIASSLIDMYGKCGSLDSAHCLFRMLRGPDVIAWGALIAGYSQYEQGAVLDLFFQMQRKHVWPDKFIVSSCLKACGISGALVDGKLLHHQVINSAFDSDRVVNNALVDMFAKCGSLREAHEIFNKMLSRDAVTWGTMIAGYVQDGFSFLALELFNDLCLTTLIRDKTIYVSVLAACADGQNLQQGKMIHEQILQDSIEIDDVIGSNLINMYVKCSDLKEARRVFDDLPKRSLIVWDAMIAGYSEHEFDDSALELFGELLEECLFPNKSIFTYVLKSCGIGGALGKGRLVHDMIIRSQFEMDVVTGTAIVDMHVKCGSLHEAHHVLNRLVNRNVVSWGALIAGYAEHGSFLMVDYCLRAMEQEEIKPNGTIFLNILTACGHIAHSDEGLRFFKMMKQYAILQGSEHYSCIIDLLGRAGRLTEASDILNTMPSLVNIVGQRSLLGNSHMHGNAHLGGFCFEQVFSTSENESGHGILFNTYTNIHDWRHDKVKDAQRYSRMPTIVHERSLMKANSDGECAVGDTCFAY